VTLVARKGGECKIVPSCAKFACPIWVIAWLECAKLKYFKLKSVLHPCLCPTLEFVHGLPTVMKMQNKVLSSSQDKDDK
jgi:hypothetical protein